MRAGAAAAGLPIVGVFGEHAVVPGGAASVVRAAEDHQRHRDGEEQPGAGQREREEKPGATASGRGIAVGLDGRVPVGVGVRGEMAGQGRLLPRRSAFQRGRIPGGSTLMRTVTD